MHRHRRPPRPSVRQTGSRSSGRRSKRPRLRHRQRPRQARLSRRPHRRHRARQIGSRLSGRHSRRPGPKPRLRLRRRRLSPRQCLLSNRSRNYRQLMRHPSPCRRPQSGKPRRRQRRSRKRRRPHLRRHRTRWRSRSIPPHPPQRRRLSGRAIATARNAGRGSSPAGRAIHSAADRTDSGAIDCTTDNTRNASGERDCRPGGETSRAVHAGARGDRGAIDGANGFTRSTPRDKSR